LKNKFFYIEFQEQLEF